MVFEIIINILLIFYKTLSFRSKTIKLEKLKAKIMQQLQSIKVENEHLRDYKAEIEHLRREKIMHVESLRLIERNLAVVRRETVDLYHFLVLTFFFSWFNHAR